MKFHLRGRVIAIAAIACALIAAPVAFATGEGHPFSLGKRNPAAGNAAAESQVIANVDKGKGGTGPNTGGYSTRQSNLSKSGGGAIYGCRATTGNEACISANNLANGDAFRFQAGPNAPDVGQIRFGADIKQLVNKPPFVTNGTGTVTNLSADKLDGLDSTDLLSTKAAADKYATHDEVKFAQTNLGPYAVVNAAGAITHGNLNIGGSNKTTGGGNTQYELSFSREVSGCAVTATPNEAPASASQIFATTSGAQEVVVTETGTTAGYGFNLTILCS
jgi:hypothetical protein